LRVALQAKRFNVLDCGRRWGKTVLGIDLAAEIALYGHPVGWFAPEYKFLSEAWRDLVGLLEPYTVRSNATEMRIELITGGVIEMWSLDGPNAGRSRKYARVIVDEAAMVPGLLDIWGKAIRPTLTDLKGDAWFMSTPNGRNDFWQLYLRGQDPLEPEWMSWQLPTVSNPFIDPDEIEAARRELVEKTFQQEYLAEFLEDGAVFSKIHEAATAKWQEYAQDGHPSHPAHSYVIGCDWGMMEDYSVFAVIDVTTKELVNLDRSNHISYTMQITRLVDLCKRFGVHRVVAENNAQASTIEMIRAAGLMVTEFHTSNESKQNIIEALKWAFEKGTLKIVKHDALIGELQAFQETKTAGGRRAFSAPKNGHDDCVMALAIAWDVAKNHRDGMVRVEKRR